MVSAAGLGAVGCSDPVGAVPGLAFTLKIGPKAGESQGCPPGEAGLGSVDATRIVYVSDGDQGLMIKGCSVSEQGEGFRVTVRSEVKQGAATTVFHVTNLTFEADGTGKGEVSMSGPITAKKAFSPVGPTCDFQLIEGAAGTIWASFECAEVTDEESTCSFEHGFFAVENCGT